MIGDGRDLQALLTLVADSPFGGSLNGIRPSFNFGGELTACEVSASSEISGKDTGVPIRVSIHLYYTTPAHIGLAEGSQFRLNVASRVFAEGVVLEIG